jgi:hypothetical protein
MSVEDIRKAELCIARNNLEHRRNATGSVSRFPVQESLDLSLGLAVIETVLERDRFLVNGDVCFLGIRSELCLWFLWRSASGRSRGNTRIGRVGLCSSSLRRHFSHSWKSGLTLNCQVPGHSGITQNLIDHAGE